MRKHLLRHFVLRFGYFLEKNIKRILFGCAIVLYCLISLWCLGALYYSNLPGEGSRIAVCIFFLAAAIGVWQLPRKYIPYAAVALLLGVIGYWNRIPASNDRDFLPSVARNAFAEFSSDNPALATIHNIRNFHYRTEEDFDVRYLDGVYDLSTLKSVDFIVVHWDGNEAIAHTMLSFCFSDGRRLAFSIETRLEQGESYNTLKGIYKQFELIYLIGTEEDLFGLRTNFRHEQLYLYPTNTEPEMVQTLFRDLLTRVNTLAVEPQFYNSITSNCTTSLLPSFQKVFPNAKFDLRILLNGFSDHYAYEYGWLANPRKDPFPLYKLRHYANTKVEGYPEIPPDYSELIRSEGQKSIHSK